VAETDAIYLTQQVVDPDEVARTRFGRPGEINDGPLELDLEAREREPAGEVATDLLSVLDEPQVIAALKARMAIGEEDG
jgi:hypothetical protein